MQRRKGRDRLGRCFLWLEGSILRPNLQDSLLLAFASLVLMPASNKHIEQGSWHAIEGSSRGCGFVRGLWRRGEVGGKGDFQALNPPNVVLLASWPADVSCSLACTDFVDVRV